MIKYAYYDENGKYIAIISENTKPEEIIELGKKYDEIRYYEE